MTTTEDNSGQSAPERGAASQPASQPAKDACVDCKQHATEPYVAHTAPVVLLFPWLPSLAASTLWPQQNTSRLTSCSSSYSLSFESERERPKTRTQTHPKKKNTRLWFTYCTYKKERNSRSLFAHTKPKSLFFSHRDTETERGPKN